jgi:hypothetical protein
MSETALSPDIGLAAGTAAPGEAEVAERTRRTPLAEQMERFPLPWRRPLQAMQWLATAALGGVSVLALLTATAAFPSGNLFVLGFLLDVESRIIHGGKLRFAVPLLPAARLGIIVLGCAAWMAPVWLLGEVARDARTIAPNGIGAWVATTAFAISAALVGAHFVLAVLRGGALGCFFRPVKNVHWLAEEIRRGGLAAKAYRRTEELVAFWRIPQRVWRGAIAYAGSVLWLAAPVALFTIVQTSEAPTWRRLAMLAGGACLACVLGWVPFLQARYAAEDRLRALAELGAVRELFCRAPLAWTLATVVTYALSIPLYLYLLHFKMRLPPHDAVWDVMLIIILATYPTRVCVAWAYRRALARPTAGAAWRWPSRIVLATGLLAYVWLLSNTPMLGDHGRRSLFEHHAVVIPFP